MQFNQILKKKALTKALNHLIVIKYILTMENDFFPHI